MEQLPDAGHEGYPAEIAGHPEDAGLEQRPIAVTGTSPALRPASRSDGGRRYGCHCVSGETCRGPVAGGQWRSVARRNATRRSRGATIPPAAGRGD